MSFTRPKRKLGNQHYDNRPLPSETKSRPKRKLEKEPLPFLNADGPSQEFIEFHTKLAGLTAVTKSYFENLVRALENHLSDVDCHQTSNRATSSKNGTSKGKGGRGKESSRAGGSSRN